MSLDQTLALDPKEREAYLGELVDRVFLVKTVIWVTLVRWDCLDSKVAQETRDQTDMMALVGQMDLLDQ